MYFSFPPETQVWGEGGGNCPPIPGQGGKTGVCPPPPKKIGEKLDEKAIFRVAFSAAGKFFRQIPLFLKICPPIILPKSASCLRDDINTNSEKM